MSSIPTRLREFIRMRPLPLRVRATLSPESPRPRVLLPAVQALLLAAASLASPTRATEALLGLFLDSAQRLGVPNIGAHHVALGDLNGDGHPDAWVTGSGGSDQIWLNDGQAHFRENGQNLTPAFSYAVALGDLDQDGDLDAFTALSDGPSRIWLNDGDALFSDSGQSLGDRPAWAVALGDFDNDGDLDAWLATADLSLLNFLFPGGGHIWLNDGHGRFSDSGQILGPGGGLSIALGDLDGDQDVDAWVSYLGGPSRWWVNDGRGNFTDSGESYGTAFGNGSALGDFDGDGDLDVWEAKGNRQAERIWFNDGRGRFTDSGQQVSGGGRNLALGDLDGDKDLDVCVIDANDANRILLNDGQGKFSSVCCAAPGGGHEAMALADLDGDGDLDGFLVGNGRPSQIWLNTGRASFIESGPVLGSPAPVSMAVADLDGDQDLDVWVSNFGPQPVNVWFNDGHGLFRASDQIFGNSPAAAMVALGDLDGDRDQDAWVQNLGGPSVIWLNDSRGRFTAASLDTPLPVGHFVVLGDLDGDGDLDALSGENFNVGTTVWLNDGSARFTPTDQRFPGSLSFRNAALGDLDGDGDLDVVFAGGPVVEQQLVWLNDGRARFIPSGQPFTLAASPSVTLGDLDGDGDLDALFASVDLQLPGTLWLNSGRGQFVESPDIHTLTPHGAARFGDVDKDGQLDALLLHDNGIGIWLNSKPQLAKFSQRQRITTGSIATYALGDFDGDSDLDLWIARYERPHQVWLNGETPGIRSITPRGRQVEVHYRGLLYASDQLLGPYTDMNSPRTPVVLPAAKPYQFFLAR